MSRIDRLIAQHCPDGVEFETLAEIGEWYGGGTPSKDKLEYWQDGTIPWVSPKDMGEPIVDTTEDYITEAAVKGSATKLIPANSVAIVVRSSILDRILPTALIPIRVALNQDMKAVFPRAGIMSGYIAHLLRSRGPAILRVARKTGGSVASIESGKLFSFRIPVPPLEIQQEIVAILDKFTKLEAELEAELEARRVQYKHYRDALLMFDECRGGQASKQAIKIKALGEIGNFVRGTGIQKSDFTETGVGCIHYGQIHTHYGTWANETKSFVSPEFAARLRKAHKGDLVIATTSEDDEAVAKAVAWVGDEDVAVGTDSYIFRHTMNPKYISYFFQTDIFQSQKKRHITGTKVRRISGDSLARITIPVPPRQEQDRIVSILDKFDALVNDLSIGLPAEIKARRKQYEHYRDRLLTFREAV